MKSVCSLAKQMGEALTVSTPPSIQAVEAPGRTQLYVGDLHVEVTEVDLFSVFSSFGVILSARVCRDRHSGESLRYAYINFASSLNALNAFRGLNHISLKGNPMRIMWINRNPIRRKNGIGNLFVKNVEKSIGAAELEELFSPFGLVDSCKVQVDEKGRSRGFGFVQMNTEEAAQAAIAALHGIVPSGARKKLYVAKFVRKCEREAPPQQPQSSSSSLYINNLENYFTDDSLREKFSEYGKIINAVVIKDEIGKSRGFGFVNFKYPEDAKKAMEAMNGAKLGSKVLFVGPAHKKAERQYTLSKHFGDAQGQHHQILATTVSVKNFDGSVTEKTLQEHFASCGKILWLKVLRYSSWQSEGFGFVCFSSLEEAIKAVITRNGTKLNGKTLYVAMDNGESQVYYPPYFNGQTHYLASAYQSGGLGFPFRICGSRSLIGQSNHYQQQPFLKPACYDSFNSPMHPLMICSPQEEAYHMQDRYLNDHYLNQSNIQPTSYEMEMEPRNQHVPLSNLNSFKSQQHRPTMWSKSKVKDAAGGTCR